MTKMVHELERMREAQAKKLLSIAARIIPNISQEDLLQPQDYPVLEEHPEFRYEEGVLAGIESALALLYALEKDAPLHNI